jgi:phosphohistidine phosphatase SixA
MFIKNKILYKDKFDLVVSSPFLRCAETTFYLTGICNKIKFNGGFSEVMNTRVLKEYIDNVSQIVKDDLENIGISRQEIDQINIPLTEESRGIGGTADFRFRNELTKIVEKAIINGEKNILVVTHGDCLGSLVTLCDNGNSVYSVDYCAILVAKFNITTKSWSLDYDKCNGVGIMKNF